MAIRLVFPFLFALLFASCSDGTQCQGSLCNEEPPANGGSGGTGGEERPPPREGPVGCYIEADRMCDCEIEEADCSEDDGQIWTEGCASCAE
jgi:hypothetical protein